ncbi:predicted protein [Postia placenta Mad-698-R]|uniref:Ty3 transposon capsid-like protein domain-containing protein n=1 Tax=Postia placenta MAD-698-R-SB12 TaxID=670580 RepID=A0A1X6MKT0_9APHY|nr:hypothetical protein POSPLADRAFT_1158843 [Postia placenta MAD-698-R-SB12]EED77233.1 predicted protein [Postia placenta Mad-698-R]OSX56792.1 hypothetical protein POSPLADRAFT_1158843 [Postia placenta MAD-698-R-SB12]
MPNAEMKSNIWPLRTGSRREGMPRGSIPNRERPATSVWLGAKRALGQAASSGPIVRRMRKMFRDLRTRHREDRAELRVSKIVEGEIDLLGDWVEVPGGMRVPKRGVSGPSGARRLSTVTANAAESTTGRVRDWIGRLTLDISRHYNGYLQSLLREVESLHITVQNQQALVDSYKRQVDALPASTGSGHSHQPKIGEPPAFKGSENKTKLEEWLDLIVLWCEHEGVATDKQQIVTVLSKLQGPAHQYMKSYYVKMWEGKDLGTWKAFVAELAQIYGQRDDKEGAKKEITALFINKDLASKDFVKYAERFRTLGRLTEYDDSLLIDKLREVIPRDMRLVLAGKDESTLPKDWTLFLNILLNINKIVNPEKARGLVFKNSGSDNGGAVPMDIDSAEKSKSKVGQKCGQAAEYPKGWR